MLRILGSRTRLCDGVSRRDAMHIGASALLGLSMSSLTSSAASSAPSRGFGRAKNCILLWLYGSPPQQETFDPKPDAPEDSRSQFPGIHTAIPGVRICQHLPLTAKTLGDATLIRSMTSPYNIHNVAWNVTGMPRTDVPAELNPRDPKHWPFFGSVLDYLATRSGTRRRDVPTQVALPWKFSSRSEPFRRAGPYGAFLGSAYDPVWAEFAGEAVKGDPYGGIHKGGTFRVGRESAGEVTLDRLDRRRSLLAQIDDAAKKANLSSDYDRHRQMAIELSTSSKLVRALDVRREPEAVRERYGQTLFGQGCLAARRLVESGVRLTTVFWDEFREANSAWDTHVRQETRLKDELLPGFDRAYSALIGDLKARGLLDETLVVVTSEHGRTPKVTKTPGGGREHWAGAFCSLLAGGGSAAGKVIGATDSVGGFPKEAPVSPKDLLATIYHFLGVDPATHMDDKMGRPYPLQTEGRVVTAAVG